MGTPIHKRKFYSFLSHAHANKDVVDTIEAWLTEKTGLPIWYDSRNLPSGAKIASELGRAIEECRSTILVLSKRSVESGWVKEEYDASVEQRAGSRDAFRIIPIKIEECEVPAFLQTTNWIDISKSGFDLDSANKLLLSLHAMDEDLDLGRTSDVFVSGSWRETPETEAWLVNAVCQTAKKLGFRLIGDSPDQQGFDGGDRVKEIISSCGGLVAKNIEIHDPGTRVCQIPGPAIRDRGGGDRRNFRRAGAERDRDGADSERQNRGKSGPFEFFPTGACRSQGAVEESPIPPLYLLRDRFRRNTPGTDSDRAPADPARVCHALPRGGGYPQGADPAGDRQLDHRCLHDGGGYLRG
jgi:hypothetical protein